MLNNRSDSDFSYTNFTLVPIPDDTLCAVMTSVITDDSRFLRNTFFSSLDDACFGEELNDAAFSEEHLETRAKKIDLIRKRRATMRDILGKYLNGRVEIGNFIYNVTGD